MAKPIGAKRRPIIAGIVAAATAGTVSLAVAATASAGTEPRTGSFQLRAHHIAEHVIDLGAKGFSAGDVDLGVDRLTHRGHTAGRLAVSCTTVHVGRTRADQLCEFAFHFAHAQLTAAGSVVSGPKGPGTFSLPIVGGTGRYRAATGQVSVTATNGPTLPITVSLGR
jgi:hypothetical protein